MAEERRSLKDIVNRIRFQLLQRGYEETGDVEQYLAGAEEYTARIKRQQAAASNWVANLSNDAKEYYDGTEPLVLGENYLPENWDYKTANETDKLGPHGEQLSEGAIGWDPYGREYWGDGPLNWIRQKLAGLTKVMWGERETPEESLHMTIPEQYIGGVGEAQANLPWIVSSEEQAQKLEEEGGTYKPLTLLGWESPINLARLEYDLGLTASSINYAFRRITQSEKSPQLLRGTAFLVGTAVDGILDTLQQGARAVEWGLTPYLVASDDAIRMLYESDKSRWGNAYGFLNWLNENVPIIREGVKLVLGPTAKMLAGIPTEEWKQSIADYRQSQIWRMGYSAAYDITARHEYMRRAATGLEDPRLLALELENPSAEMWGQIAFDVQIAYAKWIGPKLRARHVDRLGVVTHSRVVSGLDDVVGDLEKVINSTGDISESATRSLMERVSRVFRNNADEIDELGGARGPLTLTARGKRAVRGGRAGLHLQNMSGSDAIGGSVDRMGRYTVALAKLGGDSGDVAEAMATFGDLGIPLGVALSPAGMDAAIFLRGIITDVDGTLLTPKKLISSLIGDSFDTAELAEKIGGKIDDIVERSFPNLQEAIIQNDELARLIDEFGENSDEVISYMNKYPQAAREIKPVMRAVSSVDQVMQKWVYRPWGTIQGALYMGLNPGYWLRNRWSNIAHVFVDQGFEAGVRAFAQSIFSPQTALDDIQKMLGYIPARATQGFSMAGAAEGVQLWGFSKKAAQDEAACGAQIMRNSIRDTMQKALIEGRAIPSLDTLLSFNEQQRAMLVSIAKETYGSVEEIQKVFRNAVKDGGWDVARNLGFLSDDQLNGLRRLGVYDEIRSSVLASETIDDAFSEVDRILTQYHREGLLTASEPHLWDLSDMDDAARGAHADEIHFAVEEMGDEAGDLIARKKAATSKALTDRHTAYNTVRTDLNRTIDEISNEFIENGTMSGQQAAAWREWQLGQLDEFLDSRVQGITEQAVSRAHGLQTQYVRHRNILGKISGRSDEGRRAMNTIHNHWFNEDMPVDMTKRQLRSKIYVEGYAPRRDTTWITRRERVASQLDGWSHSVAKTVYGDDWENQIAKIYGQANVSMYEARLWDNAEIIDGTAYVRYNRQDLINSTAWYFSMQAEGNTAETAQRFFEKAQELGLGTDEIYDNLDTYLKNSIAETLGTVPEDIEAIKEALRIMTGEVGPEPGMMRVYQARPKGFDPAGGYSTSWSASPSQGGLYFREGEYDVFWKDVPEEQWVEAQARAISEGAAQAPEVGLVEGRFDPEFGEGARPMSEIPRREGDYMRPLVAPSDGGPTSPHRNMYETSETLQRLSKEVKQGLQENWGQLTDVSLGPTAERELEAWFSEMRTRMVTARAEAAGIAERQRDFALHNYGERYGVDLALSYIYPYSFWHKNTYMKWFQRLMYNPDIIAAYGKYRTFLEKKHAGLLDWWKHQINSNEMLGFLGIEHEHPLWFNLESTLNPLYGITNTDFEDPVRRVGWFASAMEDLNKFGPSIWTPIQLGIAAVISAQGEKEAASRWAGRLWTGSRVIRDATALLGLNEGRGYETDPSLLFFSGGVDPWERRRASRQLETMVSEGYDEAEIVDAGYNQQGPLWDEAMRRTIQERAPGNIASFFVGTGFKPRSETDAIIDQFDSERSSLMLRRDFMSEDDYRAAWQQLEQKYPFMDVLLLSRKYGPERDEALAWNVLDRIPPGQKDDFMDQANMDYEILQKFYAAKGDTEKLTDAERYTFMGAILKLSAILDIPPAATKTEWTDASNAYKDMIKTQDSIFGSDIRDLIDAFWAQEPENREKFLRSNPAIEEAMDWQELWMMQEPLMAAYYTNVEKIEKFLKDEIYDAAKKKFGLDIFDHWAVYNELKAIDPALARKYYKDHPQLGQYIDFRDERLEQVDEILGTIELPEGQPALFRDGAGLEPDEEAIGDEREEWIANQIANYVEGGQGAAVTPAGASLEQLRAILRPEEYNLLLDYLFYEQELPEALRRRLEELGILAPIEQPEEPMGGGASGGIFATRGGIAATFERVYSERAARPVMDAMLEVWSAPVVNRGVAVYRENRPLPNNLLELVVDEGIAAGMQEDEAVQVFRGALNAYLEYSVRGGPQRPDYFGPRTIEA